MSSALIGRSPDLKRLRDEGYDIAVVDGYVIMRDVPYVNGTREVKRGILVSRSPWRATLPRRQTTIRFGSPVSIRASRTDEKSSRSGMGKARQARRRGRHLDVFGQAEADGRYENHYAKLTTYANILSAPAKMIDPQADPRTFPISQGDVSDDGVFKYIDTATGRAEIGECSRKLALGKVAIVGLGGSGSYILDLVAKTQFGRYIFSTETCFCNTTRSARPEPPAWRTCGASH